MYFGLLRIDANQSADGGQAMLDIWQMGAVIRSKGLFHAAAARAGGENFSAHGLPA